MDLLIFYSVSCQMILPVLVNVGNPINETQLIPQIIPPSTNETQLIPQIILPMYYKPMYTLLRNEIRIYSNYV